MNRTRMLAISAILFTTVLWGLSFVSIKITVAVIPPMTLALLRFLIASVLLIIMLKKLEPDTQLARKDMPLMALAGIIGVTAYFYFENNGVKLTTASAASMIIATIPIFTIVGDCIFFKTPLSLTKLISVVLSVIGVYCIVSVSLQDEVSGSLLGNLFMLGASLAWVVYSLATRPLSGRYSQLAVVTYQTLFGTLALVPFSILEAGEWQAFNWDIVLHIIYLGVFCSALGYYLYVYAMDILGVGSISLFINLIPVVSVIGGFFILQEPVTALQLLGGAIILFSVYIASSKEKEKKKQICV